MPTKKITKTKAEAAKANAATKVIEKQKIKLKPQAAPKGGDSAKSASSKSVKKPAAPVKKAK